MFIFDQIRSMQIVQTAVARGFQRWTSGFVRFDRAEALAQKFRTLYSANPDGPLDLRLRRQGLARVKLLMVADPARLGFHWWLLVSDGEGQITTRETLRHATEREHRNTVAGFELVRLQRAGKVSWTWRVPLDEFETRRAYATAVATHVDPAMAHSYVELMRNWPGFSGIRAQRAEVWAAMVASRQRAGRADALQIPTLQPWPRRLALKGHGISLAVAVERMRQSINAPGEQL